MSMFDRLKSISRKRGDGDGEDPSPASDDPGSYLTRHTTPQSEPRHSRASLRIALGVMGVSLAVNAVQAVTILTMFPLYRVVPFFVTWSDRADAVVTIDPPKADLTTLTILNEMDVREYIIARNTISNDPQETIYRWGGVVKAMSTAPVYDAFLAETKPVYDDMVNHRFTRNIKVVSTNTIAPGFYRVEFDATDRRIGQGLTDGGEDHRTFIAELRVVDAAQRVRYEDRFLNPIGFTVLNYSVAPKK